MTPLHVAKGKDTGVQVTFWDLPACAPIIRPLLGLQGSSCVCGIGGEGAGPRGLKPPGCQLADPNLQKEERNSKSQIFQERSAHRALITSENGAFI